MRSPPAPWPASAISRSPPRRPSIWPPVRPADRLTLRNPDAIAATTLFHLPHGLAWPGAGSLSLRADMLVSPRQFGLPDFDLSFGDLTANGHIVRSDGIVTGDIEADTLALPPLGLALALPWSSVAHGGRHAETHRQPRALCRPAGPGRRARDDHRRHQQPDRNADARRHRRRQPDRQLHRHHESRRPTGLDAEIRRHQARRFATEPAAHVPLHAAGRHRDRHGRSGRQRLRTGQLAGHPVRRGDADRRQRARSPASTCLPSSRRSTAQGHPHLREAVTSGASPFTTLALSASFANGEGTVTAARLTAPMATPPWPATSTWSITTWRCGSPCSPTSRRRCRSTTPSSAAGRKPKPYPRLRAIQGWKAGALGQQKEARLLFVNKK